MHICAAGTWFRDPTTHPVTALTQSLAAFEFHVLIHDLVCDCPLIESSFSIGVVLFNY